MSSDKCHKSHEKHLCQIKDIQEDLEKVKSLVRDPLFLCKRCGRAAKSEDHLCKPSKM
jgi:hypothetical protein